MPRLLSALLALMVVAGPSALANPDVWVTTRHLFTMNDDSVTGLSIDWEFDPIASSFFFDQFDMNDDRVVTDTEAQAMVTEIFGSLAETNWHLHVMADGKPVSFTIESLEPLVGRDRLTLAFHITFDEPVDYRSTEMITSLHDDETFFDFSHAGEGFLKVEGPFDSRCRFVVGSGRDLLEGHTSTITLSCGEEP